MRSTDMEYEMLASVFPRFVAYIVYGAISVDDKVRQTKVLWALEQKTSTFTKIGICFEYKTSASLQIPNILGKWVRP